MKKHRWVGFDLDGTLALWSGSKNLNLLHIGKPIPATVKKAKALLTKGVDVRIMTARMGGPFPKGASKRAVAKAIGDWTLKHLGKRLPATNAKDFEMLALYDDRAIQVTRNTGRILGDPSLLGLA